MHKYFLLLLVLFSSIFFSGCTEGIDLFSQAVNKTAPKEEVVEYVNSFAPVEPKYIKTHGWLLVTKNGKTLYTYNNDEPNISNCYGECEIIWQPFLISYPEAVGGDYSYIEKNDGGIQVTLNGQPLYTYTPDTKGTASGDGKDDLWNVIVVEESDK